MYLKLFNTMTDTITTLQQVQRECEELYLSSKETPIQDENQSIQ